MIGAGGGFDYLLRDFGIQGLIVVVFFTFSADYILKKFVESETARKWIFYGLTLVLVTAMMYFKGFK